ncbi:MAG: tRNA (adenosine(37)-N6)-threonylcarbamoyltransferase complex ATPase subunit type 1 TsaE [Candidatus Eisenbacteria bacterium]
MSQPVIGFNTRLASLADTSRFAEALGARLENGDLILLEGDLGAGKTTFVQGLARGMGLAAAVKSPTYTLVHEYRGSAGPGLGHVDLYRMAPGRDLSDLGLDDLLARGAVAVEWGGRLLAGQPNALLLTLGAPGPDDDPERRELSLEPRGERGGRLYKDAVAWLAATTPDIA